MKPSLIRLRLPALLLALTLINSSCYANDYGHPSTPTMKSTPMTYENKPLCMGYMQLDIPKDMNPDNNKSYRAEYKQHYFKGSEMNTAAEFDAKVKSLAKIFYDRKFSDEEIARNKDEYQGMFRYPDNNYDFADLPMKNALYEYVEYSPNKRLIIGTDHTDFGHPSRATYFSLYSQLFLYSPTAKRYVETDQVEFTSRLAPQRKTALKPLVDSLEVFDGHPKANQLCVGPVTIRNADQYPRIEYGLVSPMIEGVLDLTYTKAEAAHADTDSKENAFQKVLQLGARKVRRGPRVIDGMNGTESCVFSKKESEETNTHPGNRDRYLCAWYYPGVDGDLKRPSVSVRLDIYKVLSDGSERSEDAVLAIWDQLIGSLRYRTDIDKPSVSSSMGNADGRVKIGGVCPKTGFWRCLQLAHDSTIYMRQGDIMPGQSYSLEGMNVDEMYWEWVREG